MIKFCPSCGENLAQYTSQSEARVINQPKYNQTEIWKELVALAESHRANPPTIEALTLPVVEKSSSAFKDKSPVRSVIHLVFDRPVAPQGGVLHQLALAEGKIPLNEERLRLNGYLLEDGHIKTVDEIPIGAAYQLIDYWGGERQHKRWHLTKPVSMNPSRHGDPYFMDDSMVAFGATWQDDEHLTNAILELLSLFAHGIKGEGCVAIPLALAVFWQAPKQESLAEHPPQ